MRPTRYAETCLVGVLGNRLPPAGGVTQKHRHRDSIQVLKGSQHLDFYRKLSELCKAGSPLSAVKANRYSPGPTEELPFVVSA